MVHRPRIDFVCSNVLFQVWIIVNLFFIQYSQCFLQLPDDPQLNRQKTIRHDFYRCEWIAWIYWIIIFIHLIHHYIFNVNSFSKGHLQITINIWKCLVQISIQIWFGIIHCTNILFNISISYLSNVHILVNY